MSFFSEPAVGSCFFQNGSQNPNRGLVGWHGPFLVASDFIWYYPPCSCPAVYPCQMPLLTPAHHGAFAHPFIDEVTFFTIPLDWWSNLLEISAMWNPISLSCFNTTTLEIYSPTFRIFWYPDRILTSAVGACSRMKLHARRGGSREVHVSIITRAWGVGQVCRKHLFPDAPSSLEMSYWLDLWFSWYQLSAVIFISR